MSSNIFGRFVLMTSVFFVASSIGGCGFKSDLFIPESENQSPLFVPDALVPGSEALSDVDATANETPPYLPSSSDGDGEEIRLDRITTPATDASILVSPDGANAEGVPVDLADLTRDIESERERNAQ